MLVKNIMTSDLTWLSINNSAKQAESQIFDLDVFHIPILDGEEFLGILSFDQINSYDIENDVPIKNFVQDLEKVSINENAFVFDQLRVFKDFDITAVPVLNDTDLLVGLLRLQDVVAYLSNTLSIMTPGAFITIKLEPNNYNLQEISRIVESNNAQITSLYFEPMINKDELYCTVKINQRDLKHIIATFERFNYHLVANSSISDNNDELNDRYDQLMKYLNI